METSEEILKKLIKSEGYLSGESLAEELNVTRAAVWKGIKRLESKGYKINSVKGGGYALLKENAPLSADIIKSYAGGDEDIVIKSETRSTNDDAKKLALEHKGKTVVVVAEKQISGRGRFSRSFYSPEKRGIYMSVVLPVNAELDTAVRITTFAGVAVARAIEKLSGLSVGIKWVNDLYVNGKKVCGILTEASCDFELKKLDFAVCGIGVNVTGLDFPENISDTATSIEKESGKKIDRNELIAEIIMNLRLVSDAVFTGEYLKEYKARSIILGKIVEVCGVYEKFTAKAVDFTDNGALVIERNAKTEIVNSADVSVKIQKGESL